MQAWRTPDGRMLVAGPVGPLSDTLLGPHGILGPDGGFLTEEHTYYELNASGALWHVYETTVSSVEYELYATTYRVEGTALHGYESSCDAFSGESRHRHTVKFTGLTPLAPEETPSEERIHAMLADEARMRNERGAGRLPG